MPEAHPRLSGWWRPNILDGYCETNSQIWLAKVKGADAAVGAAGVRELAATDDSAGQARPIASRSSGGLLTLLPSPSERLNRGSVSFVGYPLPCMMWPRPGLFAPLVRVALHQPERRLHPPRLAGQIVMEGFLDIHLPPWLRR